tara:strand:+ start:197 stop:460 length:264 start_codon:yes stop_codon:yes gene_type:complete
MTKVVINGISRDANAKEIAIIEANKKTALLSAKDDLREVRNEMLAETDWWASSDLTITDAQKKYRQDLRDITKTATSLDDVKWPEKP